MSDLKNDDNEDLSSTISTPDLPKQDARWLLIIGLGPCSLEILTDGAIITISTPSISAELDLNGHLGWSSGAFLFLACVAQPICGRIYPLVDDTGSLLFSIMLYHLRTLYYAMAPTLVVFNLGRAVFGLGAAISAILPPALNFGDVTSYEILEQRKARIDHGAQNHYSRRLGLE
ncbi:uncharacterized protein KY384_000029 [Bacidia gigantensis]|uniref:uncharacterized protein n=1 Tax=Bacidia gigantensis TaxID=2732470 RepID=UPI001D037605|nr:uncharacterized protein KY384_000029 [Bacidia gigantensis]KAG8526436.1 hypothetical protein KY384_000029 [Bacidia gigantensis]